MVFETPLSVHEVMLLDLAVGYLVVGPMYYEVAVNSSHHQYIYQQMRLIKYNS
jgi:hypothetical protein